MQEHDQTCEHERFFSEHLTQLQKVNRQIAKLIVRKDELTCQIIGALDHSHEGQKSYEHGPWKIEVRTPVVYSLNKKLYESGAITLPTNFNPIKESVSYSIDKRMVDMFMIEAPADVRASLIDLIEKKPGKASVTVKERL